MSFGAIPDEVLGIIISFAGLGAAPHEPTSPAARFACVSKRWWRVHKEAPLVTAPLVRITGWSIRASETGAGDANTIVDSWRPGQFDNPRTPSWWTSSYAFQGGHWTGDPVRDSTGGPFQLISGRQSPKLLISFQKPVKLRGLAIAARNRPRKLRLTIIHPGGASSTRSLSVPPPNTNDRPEAGLSPVKLGSVQYMRLLAQELPQGTPPKAEAILQNSALPVMVPEPVTGERLQVEILESHERGWVGINHLALFK